MTPIFRADIYRILALGFDYPTPKSLKDIEAILLDLQKGPLKGFANEELLNLLRRWAKQMKKTSPSDLETEYNRLFGTKVASPCCEGSYQLVDRGPLLGDITGFYEAFGLKFLAGEGPPDSIKMELGFLSYMALKEAFASENGLLNEMGITFDAQKKFLLDHLGRWGGIFADRVILTTTYSYYRLVATLLKVWLDLECQHFHIQPQRLPVSLPQAAEENVQCEI